MKSSRFISTFCKAMLPLILAVNCASSGAEWGHSDLQGSVLEVQATCQQAVKAYRRSQVGTQNASEAGSVVEKDSAVVVLEDQVLTTSGSGQIELFNYLCEYDSITNSINLTIAPE